MTISSLVKLSPFLIKIADSGVDKFSRIKRIWKLSSSRTYDILSEMKANNLIFLDNTVNYDNYLINLLIDTYNEVKSKEFKLLTNNNSYKTLLAFHLQHTFKSIQSLSDATTISYATVYRNVKKLLQSGLIKHDINLKYFKKSDKESIIYDFLDNLIQYVYRQALEYPKSLYSLIPLGTLVEDTYYVSGDFAKAEMGFLDEYVTGQRSIVFCIPKAYRKYWSTFFERAGISEIDLAEFDPNVKTTIINGISIRKSGTRTEHIQDIKLPLEGKQKELFFLRPELQTPQSTSGLFLGWVGDQEKNIFITPSVIQKHVAINADALSDALTVNVPEFQKIINEVTRNKTVVCSSSISSDVELVTKIVNHLFESRSNRRSSPLVIVLENLDIYCSKENQESCSVLEKLVRMGRTTGFGLIAVTQTISKIPDYLLANLNTFIIHRTIYDEDIQLLKSILPLKIEQIDKIKTLNFGECFIGGLTKSPELITIRQPRIIKNLDFVNEK
jgi:DNA-binding Lrp family transcriptional regulator